MVDCHAVNERVPELLTETLDSRSREEAYRHIEECESCRADWTEYREVWRSLGALPEVPVPAGLKARFLQEVQGLAPARNVVAFPRPAWRKWVAQAAAVVLLVGGGFFAGQQSGGRSGPALFQTEASATIPFTISERQVIPASTLLPEIQGAPEIRNVRFIETAPGADVAVSFDMTSNVTVTGHPDDKTLVNLLTYVIQSDTQATLSKSNAMEWVKQTYASRGNADPALVKALANVLKNEPHEGVRIKAVETLRQVPSASAPEARIALIEALKNDPNPTVRIKAIEALANLAQGGGRFDPQTVDMLREKAAQDDENLYVRVKAAEALSQIDL
jgi:hypothetical protein